MKRNLLALLLISTITFTGCGATQDTDTVTINNQSTNIESSTELPAANEVETESQDTTKTFNIGDTLTTNTCEITIKNIEFSYDVLPDDTSGFYTHYPADSGKVYIHIDTDVKNLQKQQMACDKIMDVTCDYNDGYGYTGQAIPEDASTGFTYANIKSIAPLETLGVRFLIDCPEEVATSANPTVIILKINGEKFQYQMK